MKVTVSKATNEGEALSVECQLNTPADWEQRVLPVLAHLDARMLEMNMRMVHATQAVVHFPKKYHAAIKVMLDAVHGCRTDALTHVPKLLEDAERSEAAAAEVEAARAAGNVRDPVEAVDAE